MQITISFYESANFTSDTVEGILASAYFHKIDIAKVYDAINEIGQELESILNEFYFGGANGAEYQGFDLDSEVFKYRLIAN